MKKVVHFEVHFVILYSKTELLIIMLLWFYKLKVRMMLSMKLVFYGAGNMAQAIFKGIINSKN